MVFRERKQQKDLVRMLQEIPAGHCSRQAQIPHLRPYIDPQNNPVHDDVEDLVGGITVQLAAHSGNRVPKPRETANDQGEHYRVQGFFGPSNHAVEIPRGNSALGPQRKQCLE